MGKRTRKAIGYGVVASLIGLGILAYFILQNRIVTAPPPPHERADTSLQDGINHYRQGDYEQSQLFLMNVVDATWDRRAKSTATLYLGNISYRKGDYEDAIRWYGESLHFDDENMFAFYNAALVSSKTGNLQKALRYAKGATQLSGDDSRAGLLLANIYFSMGRLGRASQHYEKLTYEKGISQYNLSLTLLREGESPEALDILQNISSDQSTDVLMRALCSYTAATVGSEIHDGVPALPVAKASDHMEQAFLIFDALPAVNYNSALLFLREGRHEEAIDLLNSWAIGSEHTLLLGYALYQHGDYRKALQIWEKLYEENDEDDGRIAHVLGDIHYHLGNYRSAATYYQVALHSDHTVEVYDNLVHTYMQMGEYEQAFQACDAYAKAAGDDVKPLLCLADLSFYTGRKKQAMDTLENAVRLIGDDEDGLKRVAALYARHGMYNSALRQYVRILSEHPDRSDIHGRIAEIYLHTGHAVRARDELELLLQNEQNSDILYRTSILLSSVEGGAEARERLDRLILDFPDRYEAHYNTALLLFQQGEYGETLEIIEGYLESEGELDGKAASLMHTLSGVASARLGMIDRAAVLFSKAVELDEDNELAAINLKLVQEYPF
jgi:tetratricopeptide (TPR) repeat protein